MAVRRPLPAAPGPVTLAPTALAEDDLAAVAAVLRSGWLTMGPRTMDLEAALAGRHGLPHAVVVSSDAAALHLALLAAGVAPGDEVLVPGVGGAAAAAVARRCGAVPVPVEVAGPHDPTAATAAVAAALAPRVRAVVAATVAGLPPAWAALRGLCDAHGATLVAHLPGDAAAAPAHVSCLALLPGGAAGGTSAGAVLTADAAVAATARSLRSHAMTSGTWARHTGRTDTYDVEDLGFNYRSDEVRSVLAAARLARAAEELAARAALAAAVRDALAGVPGVAVPEPAGDGAPAVWDGLPVVLADPRRRDPLRAALAAAEVETAVPAAVPGAPPVAAGVQERLLVLPLHAGMDEATALRVAGVVAAEAAR